MNSVCWRRSECWPRTRREDAGPVEEARSNPVQRVPPRLVWPGETVQSPLEAHWSQLCWFPHREDSDSCASSFCISLNFFHSLYFISEWNLIPVYYFLISLSIFQGEWRTSSELFIPFKPLISSDYLDPLSGRLTTTYSIQGNLSGYTGKPIGDLDFIFLGILFYSLHFNIIQIVALH